MCIRDRWEAVTESTYNVGNTTSDDTDGWRATNTYSSPYSLWQPSDEASYNAGNSSWGTSDGWSATKVYAEPYTFHEGAMTVTRENRAILQDLIAPDGVVPAQPVGGPYTNAQSATYYELPNWSQFSGAMTSMALAECGGTVTLQTKIGTANAADPFTYQSSVDMSTATTSAGTCRGLQPSRTPVRISALNNLAGIYALHLGRFGDAERLLARTQPLIQESNETGGAAEGALIRCRMCTAQGDFEGVVAHMSNLMAKAQKTAPVLHADVQLVGLRPTPTAQQHRVHRLRLGHGGVRQGRAVGVVGASADQVFRDVEQDAATRAHPADDLFHLGHDFGADAVAGKDEERGVGHRARSVRRGSRVA